MTRWHKHDRSTEEMTISDRTRYLLIAASIVMPVFVEIVAMNFAHVDWPLLLLVPGAIVFTATVSGRWYEKLLWLIVYLLSIGYLMFLLAFGLACSIWRACL